MNISELKDYPLNPALSYAIGLIYPLYKEKTLLNTAYIIGSVNHNPGKVTQAELNQHYKSVYELLNDYDMADKLLLRTNKCNDYSISPKKGFSILLEKGDASTELCHNILNQKVMEIKDFDDKNRQYFVRGCFDGRSSWDTTAHYLALDADRDYSLQNLIKEIIELFNINVNLNQRASNHKKNDQIRIKVDSLQQFMSSIGFFSTCREKMIENGLRKLK